jgi:hypothetical protein
MSSKLIINASYDDVAGLIFRDKEVETFCISHLNALQMGENNTVYTAQELVLYMFRALLYKDYKHLQSQVVFKFDGVEAKFDERMRTNAEYPYSLYDECLDVLLEPLNN